MSTLRLVLGSLAVALAASLPADRATADDFPRLTGLSYGRLQFERTYRSDDPLREIDQLFIRATLNADLRLDPAWSIRTSLKFEPVIRTSDDRWLDGQGLWLEEAYLDWDGDRFGAFAGKFDPSFGFAFDRAPVMFGRRLVEEYETAEKIGAGSRIKWRDGGGGRHALVASVFFQDSTPLSQSAFYRPRFGDPRAFRPGRIRESDGGPSNTRSLESFTLTAVGQALGGPLDLRYSVGWRRQRQGATETRDEDGLVAGAEWTWRLGGGVTLTPLVEYARFQDFEGADRTGQFLTGVAVFAMDGWSLATSATWKRVEDHATDSARDDHVAMVALGYTWPNGIGAEIGWKTERIRGIEGQAVGTLVRYRTRF